VAECGDADEEEEEEEEERRFVEEGRSRLELSLAELESLSGVMMAELLVSLLSLGGGEMMIEWGE
jgi:hypothetical protein